jgi:hypothetical protein
MIGFIQVYNPWVIFFIEALQKITEGVGSGEGFFFIEVLVEGHGLDEIAHPLLAEIHIGEFEVYASLIHIIQADEVKLLLAVTAQFGNCIDNDLINDFLVLIIVVDF